MSVEGGKQGNYQSRRFTSSFFISSSIFRYRAKAREILERYKDLENALLPRFSHFGYNKKIKEILKYVGIDRKVIVLDPKTREDVARPLYEVASTHTARKTFIGNLYRQVKDPNLIASMSGHSEGSRAFARYRKIDDEMKKELVNLLD